jgi:DNA adenine methylase
MSPQHPRFTPSSIQRLRNFYNPNFTVERLEFKRSIELHGDTFLYLDPPYLIESTLYGKKGNAHKDFDHKGLYDILRKRDNWILSYNDCPEIRKLYAKFHMIFPVWKYGMSNDKASREVLIFSADLNPGTDCRSRNRRNF